jgi:rod shape-determining protein MreC
LEIKNLPANTKVREGDIFVSSGLGGIFPADFPVAQVIPQGVEFKQGDSFATVKAQPLTNYEATREVLLVWRKPSAPPPSPAPAEARAKPEPTIKDMNPAKDKDKKEHNESEPRHTRRNNTKPAGGH